MHRNAHDVFPTIREREILKTIEVPVAVDDPDVPVMEDEASQATKAIPQVSFVAVSNLYSSTCIYWCPIEHKNSLIHAITF